MSQELIPLRSTVHYDPLFAEKLGIPAAILLSRIIWSLNTKIEKGQTDYFIGDKWWMYDSRETFCRIFGMGEFQFKTALRLLKTKDLIIVEKIRKKSLDHTNHYSLNMAVYKEMFSDRYDSDQSIGMVPTNRCDHNNPTDRYDSDQSIGMVPTNVSISLTNTPSKSLTKSHGGNARAHEHEFESLVPAELPPPLEIENLALIRKKEIETQLEKLWENFDTAHDYESDQILEIEALQKELAEIHLPENNKNISPEPEYDLAIHWHWEVTRMPRTKDYAVGFYKDAIEQILSKTSYSKETLIAIFTFLKSSKDQLLSLKGSFRYPWQWKDKWGTFENKLDATYSEMEMKKQKWKERL